MIDIKDLKPNGKNPRRLKDSRLELLMTSIREFPAMMELRPIIVDESGTVIGGNMRLRALKKLGYSEISESWVKRAESLTEEQKREFVVKDNASFGEWDEPMLETFGSREQIKGWGAEVQGWGSSEEVDEAAGKPPRPRKETERAYSSTPPAQAGVYRLGRHTLVCGSSLDRHAVEEATRGVEVAAVYADPPYGIKASTVGGEMKRAYPGFKDFAGDDTTDCAKESFALLHSMFPKAAHAWWGANYYASALPDQPKWVAWDKGVAEGCSFAKIELLWTNLKGSPGIVKHTWAGFNKETERDVKRIHPTQKPVGLHLKVFKLLGIESGTVLEPFGGSGSTLMACQEAGLRCIIFEIDPVYVSLIIARFKEAYPEEEIKTPNNL